MYFRFHMNDLVFSRNGPYERMTIPLQRVKSLHRRARAAQTIRLMTLLRRISSFVS